MIRQKAGLYEHSAKIAEAGLGFRALGAHGSPGTDHDFETTSAGTNVGSRVVAEWLRASGDPTPHTQTLAG